MRFSQWFSRNAALRLRDGAKKVAKTFRAPWVWLIEHSVVRLFLLFAPAKRFNLARKIAQWHRPYRRMMWRVRKLWGRRPPISSNEEEALGALLMMMKHHGVPFEPPLQIHGAESLGDQGVLIVAMHFSLNFLGLPLLSRQGRAAINVRHDAPSQYKKGVSNPDSAILGDALAFVRARQRIRDGAIVSFAIDRDVPFPGSQPIETAVGTHYVSANIIKSAALARVPVVYVETNLLPNGEIELVCYRIQATNADAMWEEIVGLVQAKIARAPFRV